MSRARYARVPSAALQAALAPSGFLGPLLTPRIVAGQRLDVQFREDDHVHVYCGLTRLVDVHLGRGSARVRGDNAYANQQCGAGLFRPWRLDDRGFAQALDRFFTEVVVRSSYTQREGAVQVAWAAVRDPWCPVDREAVIGYGGRGEQSESRRFPPLEAAQAEVDRLRVAGRPWAKVARKKVAAELDQLAIDHEGHLVLIELKDTAVSSASIYYSPLQLLQYVHEWAAALTDLRDDLIRLCEARVALGVSPADLPHLADGLRPVIGFGEDLRSPKGVSRFESVRAIANRHLPAGASPIEVWAIAAGKPIRLG